MREDISEPITIDVSATVERAMAALPAEHRRVLEGVGATEYATVYEPIGDAVDHFRRSAGLPGLLRAEKHRLANAYGVWIKDLSADSRRSSPLAGLVVGRSRPVRRSHRMA
jgi:hypothetical protein